MDALYQTKHASPKTYIRIIHKNLFKFIHKIISQKYLIKH